MKAFAEKITFPHIVTTISAVVVVFVPALAWPAVALCLGAFAFSIAKKFVPESQDAALQKIKEIEAKLIEQQTEISKLNVLLGVGMTQKNRDNLVRGLTGSSVG